MRRFRAVLGWNTLRCFVLAAMLAACAVADGDARFRHELLDAIRELID